MDNIEDLSLEAAQEIFQEMSPEEMTAWMINSLADSVHEANTKWWTDLETGERLNRNIPEMLMLTVSELAEAVEDAPQYNMVVMEVTKALSRAMEGIRKDKMDDKLPHRKAFEVELADAVIRIFDIAAGFGLDLGGAYVEKCAYNQTRLDHSIEHRKGENGKKF